MVNTEKGKEFIKKAVIDNGDGTVTVTFFGEGKKVRVQKTLPTGISPSALWVHMIEKAYAASDRFGHRGYIKRGYDSIVSGNPLEFISTISNIEESKGKIIIVNRSIPKKLFWSLRYELSKIPQTENYNLRQLDIWKQVQQGLERDKHVTFTTQISGKGMITNHAYAIIGCKKIGSHYFFKVVNPWCNRLGLRYYDIEDMKNKRFTKDYFKGKNYFLFELSHFTDLAHELVIY